MLQVKLIILSTMLGLIAACTSFPRIYSGDEIHGWVINSKTKQPIKDVVVVEAWGLQGGIHVDHTANIHIAETLTDENGYYSFPDWGPRFTMSGWMDRSSPYLKFYKFGYVPNRMGNRISGNPNIDNTVSEHSGKKIKLEKFDGTPKQYSKKLGSVSSFLRLGDSHGPFACMWKQVPVFTSEMIKTRRHFRQNGVSSNLPSLGYISSPDCQNPEQILKEYLK